MRDPTKRFSDRAETYAKYRPGYPDEVVRFLGTFVAPPATALLDPTGNPVGPTSTQAPTGEVVNNNGFSFAPYVGSFADNAADAATAGDPLYAGTWDIGILCEVGNAVNKVWNVQITFTSIGNGDFSWALGTGSTGTGPGTTVPEAPLAIGLPLAAVGVIGVSTVVLRRRRANAAA